MSRKLHYTRGPHFLRLLRFSNYLDDIRRRPINIFNKTLNKFQKMNISYYLFIRAECLNSMRPLRNSVGLSFNYRREKVSLLSVLQWIRTLLLL